jgi:hypothetical protein
MADIVSNILSTYPVSNIGYSFTNKSAVTTILNNSLTDSVNFSTSAKNLYQILGIDSQINSIVGQLDKSRDSELKSLGEVARVLFENGSLGFKAVDFEQLLDEVKKLYEGESEDKREKIANLTKEIEDYTKFQALTNLFINPSDSIFSSLSFNSLFSQNLTDKEREDLSLISSSLSRVLFTPTDTEGADFLESLNSIYALNPISKSTNETLLSLFNRRNSLLSGVLLDRELFSHYQP